jgi:hypothetical protein
MKQADLQLYQWYRTRTGCVRLVVGLWIAKSGNGWMPGTEMVSWRSSSRRPPSRICTRRHFARCVIEAIEQQRAAVIPGGKSE